MTTTIRRNNYEIHVDRVSNYLLVKVMGQNSPETVTRYLQDVIEECQRQDCFRVLIDEQLTGQRLDILEVFNIASDGAMSAMGMFQAIAHVDPSMGDVGDFAENVAVNRGMPVRTFATVEDADRWLVGQSEGFAEKAIFEEHNSRNKLS